MPSLYEYYNTGDDSQEWIYGDVWFAQTFTVGAVAHTVTSVKLKMFREGNPGTLTVGIRATDGDGKPTGADLTSGTTNANNFTTDPVGAWYEITLAEYTLAANTKYAIVCRAPSGDASNDVGWRVDLSSPTYEEGWALYSGNSGVSWTSYYTEDLMFEVWGNPVVVVPTVVTHDATDIGFTYATLNGEITNTGGANADERGFDWDTDSGAPYANSWTETDSFGVGSFSHQATGLPQGTTIYFRAKAHNSAGWGYGSELSFQTLTEEEKVKESYVERFGLNL